MPLRAVTLIRRTVEGYVEDEALSRGAAIAYYCLFSIAPLLVIAIAIAGSIFGPQAAEGAVAAQLQEAMGAAGAEVVQGLVQGAAARGGGQLATLIGAGVLLVLASGVFSEVQAALNVIFRAPPRAGGTVMSLVVNKALSFALVVLTGALLMASLIATTVLAAVLTWATNLVPRTIDLLALANLGLSFALLTALVAGLYKFLPNRPLRWRDALVGAAVTALLFTIGKSLIGWYIATSGVASTYGAAGTFMALLLWIYYSAQIFLLGAEFTRAWAGLHGAPVEAAPAPAPAPRRGRGVGMAALAVAVLALLPRRRRAKG